MGLTPMPKGSASRGLADLLGHDFVGGPSSSSGAAAGSTGLVADYDSQLRSSARHVVLSDESSDAPFEPDADVHEAFQQALTQRLVELEASTATASSSSSSEEPAIIVGRIGPPRVTIDRASSQGQLQFGNNDLAAESLTNFSSFRANACCFSGKWMYEATIQTAWQPGIQQIGWATAQCPFTAEEGVGDAPDSYAYGGCLMRPCP